MGYVKKMRCQNSDVHISGELLFSALFLSGKNAHKFLCGSKTAKDYVTFLWPKESARRKYECARPLLTLRYLKAN